jgi:hypothetical protein
VSAAVHECPRYHLRKVSKGAGISRMQACPIAFDACTPIKAPSPRPFGSALTTADADATRATLMRNGGERFLFMMMTTIASLDPFCD